MRRIRLLGLALTAIFALGVVGASSAMAEEAGNPQILPAPTAAEPLTFTVTGTNPFLETSAKGEIKCEKVEGLLATSSFTSRRLGTVDLHFGTNCLLNKTTKCKAEGDVNGTILLKADIHLVDVLPVSGELRLGLEILPLEVPYKITCGIGKVEVTGSAIGLATAKTGVELEETEVKFEQSTAGMQTLTKCDLTKEFCEPGGVAKNFLLEAEAGKGKELAAEVATVKVHFDKKITLDF